MQFSNVQGEALRALFKRRGPRGITRAMGEGASVGRASALSTVYIIPYGKAYVKAYFDV